MEITNLAAAEECCKRSAASRMLPLQIMLVVGIVAIWLLCMGLI